MNSPSCGPSRYSVHNDVAGNLSKAIEVGYYDATMFAYNIVNHAALENPNLSCCVAQMETIDMFADNIKIMGRKVDLETV